MKKMDEAQLLELPKTMLIDLLTQMHVPTAKIEEASSDKYKERDGKPDKGPLVKLVIRYNGGHPEIHQIRTLLTPPCHFALPTSSATTVTTCTASTTCTITTHTTGNYKTKQFDPREAIASAKHLRKVDELKAKELEALGQAVRPHSAPRERPGAARFGGAARPGSARAAARKRQVPPAMLEYHFACPNDEELGPERMMEVQLPDGREFTLRVPDEYKAGEEFAATFPPKGLTREERQAKAESKKEQEAAALAIQKTMRKKAIEKHQKEQEQRRQRQLKLKVTPPLSQP
jgi:hypothetical protein